MDDLTKHYSDRLGTLTGKQLQAAADRFDLGTVTAAEPASGGLFGQNVVLTTSEGKFVLRGHPHGHPQLVKERVVARLIHEHSSLPAPWPYEICDDPSLFGWTYAVMPFLPGTCGSDLFDELDETDRVRLAAALGEGAARLHEVRNGVPGPWLWDESLFVPKPDFARWTLQRLEWWRAGCRDVRALEPDDERYIDDVIERHADALRVPVDPVLVHHDYKLGNTSFVRRGDGFEACGVFDLMEAYFGDGEEDLVRTLWSYNQSRRDRSMSDAQAEAFVGTYAASRPLRPGAADRLALYALSDWLVIFGYVRRHQHELDDVTFRETAEPIVARAWAAGDKAGLSA